MFCIGAFSTLKVISNATFNGAVLALLRVIRVILVEDFYIGPPGSLNRNFLSNEPGLVNNAITLVCAGVIINGYV